MNSRAPAEIRVAPHVYERLREVETDIRGDVRDALLELAHRPRLGTPLDGEFSGMLAYQFRVNRLPTTRVFTLLYEYDPESHTISALDVGVLQGRHLAPPSFRVHPAPEQRAS